MAQISPNDDNEPVGRDGGTVSVKNDCLWTGKELGDAPPYKELEDMDGSAR